MKLMDRFGGGATISALTLTLALSVGLSGCASSTTTVESSGGAGASEESVSRLNRATRTSLSRHDAPIAAVLNELGDDAKAYHAHVITLSNPYFEGRAPGSRGVEAAADYIEFHMREIGLEPAFESIVTTSDGAEVLEPSYRQNFTIPGGVMVNTAAFSWRGPDSGGFLTAESDFDPMPFTGSGEADGDVVFVGYAIESGPDDYTSFQDDPDLSGKIVMMYRFEPMDADGKSLWSTRGRWSSRAGLTPKIRSVTDRGASGVIFINPPGADDPRADSLMSIRGSRFGGNGDVPVIMVAPEAAERMVAAAGTTLSNLRTMADEGAHGAISLDGVSASIDVDIERLEIATDNVAGVLPGKGSLRNNYVVIGAHYDHVGYGEYGTRSPGLLHPGADDNASGTAGVILAASKLNEMYDAMPEDADARSIIFIGFTAEEMGLLGSRHFVQEPPVALSQISAMLNMDMIGRVRDNSIEILGVGTGEEFEVILDEHVELSGINAKLSELPGGRSDHAPFSDEGVPALAFFSGLHTDYHAPGDVGSKVSFKGAVRVTNLVSGVAFDIATRPAQLTYVEEETEDEPSQGPRMANMSVRLGIAPGNYADDQPGVLVGGVSEGTSAAKAGLKEGDRIVSWNGEELLDIGGMMRQLASHKPGDVAQLVVIRDGARTNVDVTLQPREGAN